MNSHNPGCIMQGNGRYGMKLFHHMLHQESRGNWVLLGYVQCYFYLLDNDDYCWDMPDGLTDDRLLAALSRPLYPTLLKVNT